MVLQVGHLSWPLVENLHLVMTEMMDKEDRKQRNALRKQQRLVKAGILPSSALEVAEDQSIQEKQPSSSTDAASSSSSSSSSPLKVCRLWLKDQRYSLKR